MRAKLNEIIVTSENLVQTIHTAVNLNDSEKDNLLVRTQDVIYNSRITLNELDDIELMHRVIVSDPSWSDALDNTVRYAL